jgi:hypothetical protein
VLALPSFTIAIKVSAIKLEKSAAETLSIVADLKLKGFVQGKDFDFSWYQSRWSDSGTTENYVEFVFYKEQSATWFALIHPS